MKMLLFLSILVAFVGFTAFISGFIMICKPDGHYLGLSTTLLKHTPFKSFFLPGVLLAMLIGGVNLLAVFLLLTDSNSAYIFAFAAGILLFGWIIVQMLLIKSFHSLQDLYLLIGFLIIIISYQFIGKAAL
jgi:hypothetical protein